MILTGKDIRVLLGSMTMFVHLHFVHVKKRRISSFEEDKLERIYEELFEEVELNANWRDADSWMVKVSKRLAVSIDKEFSKEELTLLTDVLTACIQEIQDDSGVTYYLAGNDYGIVFDDFQHLLTRLQEG